MRFRSVWVLLAPEFFFLHTFLTVFCVFQVHPPSWSALRRSVAFSWTLHPRRKNTNGRSLSCWDQTGPVFPSVLLTPRHPPPLPLFSIISNIPPRLNQVHYLTVQSKCPPSTHKLCLSDHGDRSRAVHSHPSHCGITICYNPLRFSL